MKNNFLAVGNITFNLRFAGQYFDYESGLHYNNYKIYNPEIGRYMQSDPTRLAAGSNTYNYVGKNPLSMVDPLGLDQDDINKIQNTFYETLNTMIKNHQRLPGKGGDWFNINNIKAKACNPNIENSGPWPFILKCEKNDDKLEYCAGQSAILSKNLSNISGLHDFWTFKEQDNSGHFWLVGLSYNFKNPILYLDISNIDITYNNICPHCSNGEPNYNNNSRPIPIRN